MTMLFFIVINNKNNGVVHAHPYLIGDTSECTTPHPTTKRYARRADRGCVDNVPRVVDEPGRVERGSARGKRSRTSDTGELVGWWEQVLQIVQTDVDCETYGSANV